MARNPLPEDLIPDIPIIRFVVGPKQRDFIVDTDELFNVSDYFNEFLMAENLGVDIAFEEEDPEVFACFVKFVEREEYLDRSPTRDPLVDSRLGAPVDGRDDLLKNAPSDDFSQVYLRHAAAHRFAVQYDVQEMKKFAFTKLSNLLGAVRLYPQRTRDFVPLVRYIYDNIDHMEARMKTRVVSYCALHLGIFGRSPDFLALLKAEPEFLDDLMPYVADLAETSKLVDPE